jgi:hypothetical protein
MSFKIKQTSKIINNNLKKNDFIDYKNVDLLSSSLSGSGLKQNDKSFFAKGPVMRPTQNGNVDFY